MNNMCLSSYDYLQKMSDSDSVNYNVADTQSIFT